VQKTEDLVSFTKNSNEIEKKYLDSGIPLEKELY
jgi:hypothetical protein